jgi:DNA-binding CsgD family transcriptional regulator
MNATLLSTRILGGCVIREYLSTDRRHFVTWEVPEAVIRAIGIKRIRDQIAIASRGVEKRDRAALRKAAIAGLLRKGKTPVEVAKYLSVSPTYARMIRRESNIPALPLKTPRASPLRDSIIKNFELGVRDTKSFVQLTGVEASYVRRIVRGLASETAYPNPQT